MLSLFIEKYILVSDLSVTNQNTGDGSSTILLSCVALVALLAPLSF